MPRTASFAADVAAMGEAAVFVVGDILLDVYVEGEVERISPEAPVPVVHEHRRSSVLGGAANVAANVAAFASHVVLSGRLGDDDDGRSVRDLLSTSGVDSTGVVTCELPTVRKTRLLAGHQQIARVDRESIAPLPSSAVADVVDSFVSFARRYERAALVISDYAKGMVTPDLLRVLLAQAEAMGVPSVVDPKPASLPHLNGATIVKPNRREAMAATPTGGHDDPAALCAGVLAVSGAENVVVSLSEDGVVAAGRAVEGIARIPSTALDVADVSGAGDTMVAVLALGTAARLPFPTVVAMANAAAGVVCGRHGTAVVTPSDLLSAMKVATEATGPAKILANAGEAAAFGAAYRAGGRTVVFTNGCFDVVHAGHVQLLQRARACGDVLVVGLNSDASVARLKGPTRPVQSEADRAAVLAGLAAVDAVVVFDEDTPLDLILRIRPDVIVKGGDYRPAEVVGGREAGSWGGRVEIIPLLEGRSSTRVLTALQAES